MAWPVAYSDIKARILVLADVVNSPRHTSVSSPLMTFVNGSISRLYDEITAKVQDFSLTETPITITKGVSTVGLPSDFYKLRDVFITDGDLQHKINPFSLQQEAYINSIAVLNPMGAPFRYRLQGSNLFFAPVPSDTYPGTLKYVPTAPLFTGSATTVDFVNGWDTFVLWDVAAMVLDIEGRESGVFHQRAEQELQRAVHAAATRNHADPELIMYFPDDATYSSRGRY